MRFSSVARPMGFVFFLLLFTPRLFAADISIIPKPMDVKPGNGTFQITGAIKILQETSRTETSDAAIVLADRIANSTGMRLAIQNSDIAELVPGAILLTTRNADSSLGDEGYQLQVSTQGIIVRASGSAGMFYGVQTLLQLLPPAIFGQSPANGIEWNVPAVSITDQPRFRWRGVMLDVARHFEPKAAILRFLDILAMHKVNVFHWHLVDDQGWRIEIKKYPKLTEIGAWRTEAGFGIDPKLSTTFGPDGRYGGFYTQDDIREIVKYAARLHITIVPEIEMPGHSTAALAAYPELSTTGGPFTITAVGGIFHSVFCAGDERTFTFMQDVLNEVMDIFPSTYIHVGGDEVPAGSWDDPRDQALIRDQKLSGPEQVEPYFMSRIAKMVEARGRKMIGWDEILNPNLSPGAAVMVWHGAPMAANAATAGHDSVMSPTQYCYLDYSQGTVTEPRPGGSMLTLAKVYSFEPLAGLTADQSKHILGVQGNLWTERVPNIDYAGYMTWPRAAALAEIGWTAAGLRNLDDFRNRMKAEELRLDAAGIDYRPVEDEELQHIIRLSTNDPSRVEFIPGIAGAEIFYSLDHSYPTRQSTKYDRPFAAPNGWSDIKVGIFRPGSKATIVYVSGMLDGREARVTTTLQRDAQGGDAHPADLFWTRQPPNADDNVIFEFDMPQVLKTAIVHTGVTGENASELQSGAFEVSTDGRTFTPVATFANGTAQADLGGKQVKAIRIRVTNAQPTRIIFRDVILK